LLFYRNGFKLAAIAVAVIATSLGFVYPAANAVALMVLGAPCVPILWKEIQRSALLYNVKLIVKLCILVETNNQFLFLIYI
jgi:uncharacterized protein YqgC (DUF456 family)